MNIWRAEQERRRRQLGVGGEPDLSPAETKLEVERQMRALEEGYILVRIPTEEGEKLRYRLHWVGK